MEDDSLLEKNEDKPKYNSNRAISACIIGTLELTIV